MRFLLPPNYKWPTPVKRTKKSSKRKRSPPIDKGLWKASKKWAWTWLSKKSTLKPPVKPPLDLPPTSRSYQFVEKLGKGRYSNVSLMVSKKENDKKVAVKVMRHNKGQKKSVVTMMDHWIPTHKLACEIDHTSILQLFQIKKDRRNFYIMMEYADAGTLLDHIEPDAGMSCDNADLFFKQIIDGIEYLHGIGIVHRDIQPANLFLTSSDVLKIGEFGTAVEYLDENNEEVLFDFYRGTRRHMAPEVLECGYVLNAGKFRGPPVDIWGAGVTFLMMSLGRYYWSEATMLSKKFRYWVAGNYTDKDEWMFISIKTRKMVFKMLTVDPQKRATLEDIKKDEHFSKYCSTREVGKPAANKIAF